MYVHPNASVSVTPPRSRSVRRNSEVRKLAGAEMNDPPLARNILNYYNAGDTAVLIEEHAMNITVKEAIRSRGAEAERVILKEQSQMIDKKVWIPVHMHVLTSTEKQGIIRSQMFLKEKYLPTGKFEKLKARLIAGGNQQDKELYDDLSSPA